MTEDAMGERPLQQLGCLFETAHLLGREIVELFAVATRKM
jgi:hypothetical protein